MGFWDPAGWLLGVSRNVDFCVCFCVFDVLMFFCWCCCLPCLVVFVVPSLTVSPLSVKLVLLLDPLKCPEPLWLGTFFQKGAPWKHLSWYPSCGWWLGPHLDQLCSTLIGPHSLKLDMDLGPRKLAELSVGLAGWCWGGCWIWLLPGPVS